MADVKREVLEVVRGGRPWGIDVVDVRITRVDYVEVRDPATLTRLGPGPATGPARVLAAAVLGRTRLIDNLPV